MLDTHAHLTNAQFAEDLPEVLSRASSRGVTDVVCVTLNPSDAHVALSLSNKHASLHAAAGLHPCDVAKMTDSAAADAVDALAQMLRQQPRGAFVAIGEVGLDFTPRVLSGDDAVGDAAEVEARQRRSFRSCLELSRELDLPISAHSRGAGRHAVEMIEAAPGATVVLHCFDGRAVYAERAVAIAESTVLFSVPPCVVRSVNLQKMVRRVALDRLLLETDSPVLGVVAAERNEPAEVTRSLEMIAALKGMEVEECKRAIDANARRVFPLVYPGGE